MSSNRGSEPSSRVTSSSQRHDDVSWGEDDGTAAASAAAANDDGQAAAASDDALHTVAMPPPSHPVVEDDASPVQVMPLPAAVAASHIFSATTAPSASPSSSDDYVCPDLPIAKSPTFINFRAHVQKRRIAVGKHLWTYYDLGPRNDPAVPPLICLPVREQQGMLDHTSDHDLCTRSRGTDALCCTTHCAFAPPPVFCFLSQGTSGTAESFFEQVMSLGNRGYRVISCNPPAYWTLDEFCNGFNGFLYAMGLTTPTAPQGHSQSNSPSSAAAAVDGSASAPVVPATGRVHVLANSLAGYLCLYYLSHIMPEKNYIASLLLCNSFIDTQAYQAAHGGSGGGGASSWCLALLKRAPDFVLKKFVLDSMPQTTAFPHVSSHCSARNTRSPGDMHASLYALTLALALSCCPLVHLSLELATHCFCHCVPCARSLLCRVGRRLHDRSTRHQLALRRVGQSSDAQHHEISRRQQAAPVAR